MATQENSKTKILVKVHEPLIEYMQINIDAACLKRDAYLDKALRVEAEFLRKEITTPNSDKAKNYIAAQLSDLKLKPLNLLLSTETVDLINEVCKEKNVPRDAFMNRFFLLLTATDTVLEALFLDDRDSENVLKLDMKYPHDCAYDSVEQKLFFDRPSILDTLEDFVTTSPFFRMRACLHPVLYADGNPVPHNDNGLVLPFLYMFDFRKTALQNLPDNHYFFKVDNALGFNTFMPDEEVVKLEELDAASHKEMIEKSKVDKLIAFRLKEKQARAVEEAKDEEKQARQEKQELREAKLAKAKSAGEEK